MPPATWSPDEVLALRRRYSRTPDAELATALGKTSEDVATKARELALAKDKKEFKGRPMPRWTPEQIAELRRDYGTTSNLEFARRFGRSVKSVNSKAHHLKLRKDAARLESMGRENVALRRDRTRTDEQRATS